MFYRNGAINTFVLMGFAKNEGDGMQLRQCSGADKALRVELQGARRADYDFEPVILLGSFVRDDKHEDPYFVAQLTLRASKAHVPPKLKWNKPGLQRDEDFFPLDLENRFKVLPEILEPLPDTVEWPEWLAKFAREEGGEFAQMLTESISAKSCWGIGLITGYARYQGLIPSDKPKDAGDYALSFRLRKKSKAIQVRMSEGTRRGTEMVDMVRRRHTSRSPITAVARPYLASPNENTLAEWSLRFLDIFEAGQEDFTDPTKFFKE